MSDTEDIREIARKRIKAKRDFWTMLTIFVLVTIALNIIWWFSGAHEYYWPIWPTLGFLIGTVATAISVFGSGGRPITEADIDREIKKLQG